MPGSKPPAGDLLDVAREFMERELLPALSADLWFQCKVTINILGIVRREMELGPEQAAAERRRLVRLLGEDASVGELNRRLATCVREGRMGDETPGLIDHLRATLKDGLKVNNPKWLE